MRKEKLLREGWSRLGLITDRTLTRKFKDFLLGRFQDVSYFPNPEYLKGLGQRAYDVIVKTFSNMPERAQPGRYFIPVTSIGRGEVLPEGYIDYLTNLVRQGSHECSVEIRITPGPSYEPSAEFPGQWIRNPRAHKVVWMRWT